MWRLMYAVLVVSSNGSVSTDSSHTDWPSEQACQYAAKNLYPQPSNDNVNGVKITIKVNTQCVPLDGPQEMPQEMPPPVGYYGQPPPPPSPPPPYGFRGGFPGITFGPRGVRVGPIH
jgi:hypothetical protein